MLSFQDRAQIAVGIKQGLSDRQIGALIEGDHSVVWRERHRNQLDSGVYKPVSADGRARRRRAQPQTRKLDTDPVLKQRVLADLRLSRTPRQIAGRLQLEMASPRVELMEGSPPVDGRTVSHEAIYQWIYAHPKGELARERILLRSKQTRRKRRRPLGERTGGRIIRMISIDDRPDDAARTVPGACVGDLIIGKGGKSAVATLVERHSRFVMILGLPEGKRADPLADILIDTINQMPRHLRRSLTWDQGTEMARHAEFTLATNMPVYFAHPHSP